MEIRDANAGDLPEVLQLERVSATAPHWPREAYEVLLRTGDAAVRRMMLVAVREGVLQGFAVSNVLSEGDEAELESVVVRADERRKGVGRELCRGVMEWGRDQGARTMLLEVRAGSAGAIRLYLGLGFTLVGRRSGYYADPEEDALVMRSRL